MTHNLATTTHRTCFPSEFPRRSPAISQPVPLPYRMEICWCCFRCCLTWLGRHPQNLNGWGDQQHGDRIQGWWCCAWDGGGGGGGGWLFSRQGFLDCLSGQQSPICQNTEYQVLCYTGLSTLCPQFKDTASILLGWLYLGFSQETPRVTPRSVPSAAFVTGARYSVFVRRSLAFFKFSQKMPSIFHWNSPLHTWMGGTLSRGPDSSCSWERYNSSPY